MTVKIKVSILLFLFFSPFANAEFNQKEKDEVATQMIALSRAASSAYWAVQHGNSVRADIPLVALYVSDLMYFGWEQHQLAVVKLLDMSDSDGTRQTVIDEAVAVILRDGYAGAEARLNAIQSQSSFLTNAKTRLTQAKDARASFDGTLPYVEPRMDVNLATTGATRDKSAAIGPHGDYRAFGEALKKWTSNNRREWIAAMTAMNACNSWVSGSKGGAFAAGHLLNTARGMMYGAALLTNIFPGETVTGTGLTLKGNVDIMTAGGTTARPPEFFNVQLALEIYLMWTHVGPEPYDVNGRHTARGLTYDLTVSGQVWALAARSVNQLCAEDKRVAFLDAVGSGINGFAGAWGNMDDASYHGMLLLKHFQVFPPPGPGGGGCEDCPPTLACDPATTEEVDGVCVALATTCPGATPRLEILGDSIRAVCDENP